MFESTEEIIDNTTHIKIINRDTGEYLEILPHIGASLHGLKLQKDGVLFDIIDGYSDQDKLDDIIYYKGMILYPYPNRVASGKYTFEGKNYQLAINEKDRGNALHGLISEATFTIKKIELLQNLASIELYFDILGLDKGFPFKSRINIIYTITDKSKFICRAIVESKDTKNQPVGLAWHPYFKTPNQIDKLEMLVNSKKIFDVNNNLIPTGNYTTHHNFDELSTIGNIFLDTGYEVLQETHISTTEIVDKENNITLNIWQETGNEKYNYLQIYTPKHRKSIAIEPMTCAIDAFNNGFGLICLKPEAAFAVEFGVFLT